MSAQPWEQYCCVCSFERKKRSGEKKPHHIARQPRRQTTWRSVHHFHLFVVHTFRGASLSTSNLPANETEALTCRQTERRAHVNIVHQTWAYPTSSRMRGQRSAHLHTNVFVHCAPVNKVCGVVFSNSWHRNCWSDCWFYGWLIRVAFLRVICAHRSDSCMFNVR